MLVKLSKKKKAYVIYDSIGDVTVVVPVVDVMATLERAVAEADVGVDVAGGVGVGGAVPGCGQVQRGPLPNLAVVLRGVR